MPKAYADANASWMKDSKCLRKGSGSVSRQKDYSFVEQ